MLVELTQAVLAVAVGLVLPGYFWSRLLFNPQGWAEHLTMSVALALALVPAAALLLVTVLGSGVTLVVAVCSVLLVGAGGAAVLRAFGPSRACDSPLELSMPPLGPLALIPLGLAAALTIPTVSGDPAWRAWENEIFILIVATAVLAAVEGRRGYARGGAGSTPEEPLSARPPEPSTGWRSPRLPATLRGGSRAEIWIAVLLPVILLLVLARGYARQILESWPYITPPDQHAHAIMANLTLKEGSIESAHVIYPPGFHVLSAVLSQLGGITPLELYTVLSPALALLPTLSAYVLARRLFGLRIGLATALIVGLVLENPPALVRRGIYVELIAAQFLFVLAVAAVQTLLRFPSSRHTFLFAVLSSATVLYHSISSVYVVLLGIALSVLVLPYTLWKDRTQARAVFVSLLLLGVLSLAFTWETYEPVNVVRGLLGMSEASETAQHVATVAGTQRPYPLADYPQHVGVPVAWLGLLGALLLIAQLLGRASVSRLSVLLLLGWCLTILLVSQTPWTSFPRRFTEDLGVPLSVLAAFSLVSCFRIWNRARLVSVVTLVLVAAAAAAQVQQNFETALDSSSRVNMWPELEAAGNWLATHNSGGSIITNASTISNSLRAIGGYSNLPVLTQRTLATPRGISVEGQKRARDVLWVHANPEGERTRAILREYDVRYVVFVKQFPENSVYAVPARGASVYVDWTRFARSPDLYEAVYENDHVVIFRVKAENLSGWVWSHTTARYNMPNSYRRESRRVRRLRMAGGES